MQRENSSGEREARAVALSIVCENKERHSRDLLLVLLYSRRYFGD
jgi:hypothetical protein